MAGYTQQYSFNVNANTSGAQSALDKLQSSLKQLQAQKFQIDVNDGRIIEASNAAQTLQQHLQAAMNVKTGQLDLTKLNNSLTAAGTSVSKLSQQFLAAGSSGQQAFSDLSNAIAATTAPVKQLSSALTTMGTTLINTIKWQAASSLIHGLMSSISGAISYAKNLNSTLNDIRIVTGASSDDMARFAVQANAAAKSLSTSTGDFAKASLIYYQQGDSAALAAEKATITTKAANIAFTASAQEMSQMLTAVWNSYRMGEDQLEHAVDVMAKLGATTATSMEEIATAMQKVAATANTVGVSMEQMSALIATSSSVTRQSAETVGTAWNTILSRITSLKLGESLEDGVDLTKYTKALESIGVSALDATGNLREAGTLIDEIGSKWQTMGEAQKAAFAQTVGGVRQYTQIMALFENFDKYQANLKNTRLADGELNKQQEIYAESWEAASKRVKASLEGLYTQLIDDKAITKLTSMFAKIIDGFTKLTESFGGAGNFIGLIVGQIATSHIDTFATKIGEIGTNLKQLFTGNQEIDAYAQTLSKMQEQMRIARDTEGMDQSYKTQLDYDTQIFAIKQKLAESQNTLTQKQKDQMEVMIQQLQTSKEFYVQQIKNAEATQKEAEARKAAAEESIKQQAAINGLYSNSQDFQNASWVEQRASMAEIGKNDIYGALWDGATATAGIHATTEEMTNLGNKAYDTYQYLQDLANKLNIIRANSNELTLDELLESCKKVNEQVQLIQNGLNAGNAAFKSDVSQTDWKAERYEGTDEDRFALVQSLGERAKSMSSFLSEDDQKAVEAMVADLEKLGASGASVEKLNEALALFQRTLHDAGSEGDTGAAGAAKKVEEALTAMGLKKADIEGLIESARKLANAGDDLGGKVDKMADDADAALQRFKAQFEASMQGASTAVQSLVTTAMTLQRISTAVTSIHNWSETMNSSASAGKKLTTTISTLVTFLMATKSITDLLRKSTTLSSAAQAYHAATSTAAAAGQGLFAQATAGATAAMHAFNAAIKANPIGLIVTAIAGATLAIVALIKYFSKLESAEERTAKKRQELTNQFEELKIAQDETASSLQNLADVIQNTNMTFQEQLTAITDITDALGLEVSAVDILTGKYSGLNRQVQEYLASEFTSNAEAANSIAEEYENNLDVGRVGLTGANDTSNMFTDIMIQQMLQSRLSGLSNQNGAILAENGDIDFSNAYMLTGGIDEARTAISNLNDEMKNMGVQSAYLEDILSFIDNTYEESGLTYFSTPTSSGRSSNLAGFHSGDEGYANTATFFEKDYGLTEEGVRTLWEQGLLDALDPVTHELLQNLNDAEVDFEDIQFSFKNSFENVDWQELSKIMFNNLANNFTNASEIQEQTETLGVMRTWRDANSLASQILTSQKNENADLLGVNGPMNLDEFNEFLANGDALNAEWSTLTQTINLLGESIGSASEAATQAQAVGEYAGTLISSGNFDIENAFNTDNIENAQTQLYKMLADYLGEHPEITWDQMITIRPSALKVKGDKIEIDDSALKVASLKTKKVELETEQSNIKSLQDLKSENLTAEDYQTVANSGVFEEGSPEFKQFMTANKAQRTKILEELLHANAAETYATVEETLAAEQKELETISADINTVKEQIFNDWVEAQEGDTSDFSYEKQGEEIVLAQTREYINAQRELEDQRRLFTLQAQDVDSWTEADKDFITKRAGNLGIDIDEKTGVNHSTISQIFNSEEYKTTIDKAQDINNQLSGTVGQLNLLEAAEQEATGSIESLNTEMAALKFDAEYTQPLQKATEASQAFAAAIGQQGQLSGEALSTLAKFDEEVYNKYQNLSSDEWNKYAYESAKEYYMKLAQLRSGDLSAQIEIQSKLDSIATEYYKGLADKVETLAAFEQEQWDKQLAGQEAALKTISSNLTNLKDLDFQGIEDLKQNLLDSGIAAERVAEIINNISNAKTDKEEIRAGMVAATEAALAKLQTLGAEKKEFEGVITSLDTSAIDDIKIPLPIDADTKEAEETLDEITNTDHTTTLEIDVNDDNVVATSETWDTDLSNKTLTVTGVNGDTVSSTIEQWHSDISNQIFTVTLDTGEQITSTITGWRTELNDSNQNVLKFSIQNGDGTTGTVEQTIKSWIPDGKKVLITVDDGEEETTITAKIDSWVYGQNSDGKRYITVAMDNGSTLTTDVTEAIDNSDGTVTIEMADGSKTQLPTDIKTSIGNGYDVPLKAGNSLQPDIDNMNLTATVTIQTDAAQEALNQMFKQIDLDFTYFFTDTDYHAAAELLAKPFEEMMETLSEEESWKTGLFGWGKGGEGIKWDGTQGYVMKSLVEHLTKMPESEFTKMGKEQLQLIIGALGKAMESSDANTRELATQLWAGLSVGMKDNYDAETWAQILESCGLSEDMLQAFKDALGIESPSKLTKGLAHFLFEGLVAGMKDGDAAFEGVDLPNVREKIKDSVENAIDEIGIEKIISDSYQQQLNEALNKNLNQEEKANKLMDLGFNAGMSNEIAQAGGVQEAAKARGDQAYKAAFNQYMVDHAADSYQFQGQLEAAAEKSAKEAQKAAIDKFDAEFVAAGDQSASNYLERYLKNKEWNLVDSKTLTDVQKHILNAALNKTLSDLNIDSIDEAVSKYGQEKVMEVFEKNINTSSEEVTKAVQNTWNEIQEIWKTGLDQIFANEEAKAAETYELWKNTFKAIADARAGLMEGKTIMQSLYQNPDELANVITMLLNQGYEMSEIYKMLNDPDAILNFQAFDAEAYRMSGKQKYLNLDENGNYANTSESEFRSHVAEDVARLADSELASVFQESLGGTEGLKTLAQGDASQRALLQQLIDKQLIGGQLNSQTGEFENVHFLSEAEMLGSNTVEQIREAVIDGIMQGMDQSSINALLGEASATQTAGYYGTMMQAQSEGEKQLGIWQNNADLINNAFSTLLEKGNLDSMSLDDQNELVKILQDMGILGENADASSLSLETLQTAAEQTASAMQTLAEEITKAMQMLANGEADSWQIGDDGHVTVSQSYAQAEANGFENVAMDEDKLAELQAAMEAEAAKRAQEKIRQEGYTMDQVTNDSSAVGETARSIYEEAKAKALEEVKKETQVGIKLGEESVSDDIAGDTITSGQQAVNQQQVQTMEAYAKACGLANDEYKKLLTQVSAVSNKTQEFNTLSKAEQQQLMSVVTATKKAETAWDNLATKQKDAIEIIKTGNKTDLEYLENLNAVTSNVKDIFGGASAITNEFVESHIADIEKMAAGDEDAAERVEEAWLTAQAELDGWDPHKTVDIDVNQDGVIDELDNLGTLFDSYFDQWTNEPIGFSLEADDSQVIETLQNLIDSGDMTAEGINEALAGIGWEPEIEYVPMTSEMKAQQQIGATVYDFYGNPFTVTEEALADNDLTFYMPHIKSVKKQSTGAHSMPQSTRRRVTERPRTGRRTGDRSRREDDRREEDERDYGDPASREWEKKTKDEIERYHQVNKQLDYQSTFLERINKLKGFKYGVDYVNALRQENAELVRQAELQKKKYEEAQKWLAYDQSRLGSLSQQTISWWAQDEQERREVTLGSLGLANITPTYDEDGNLNYQDLREQMIRQYNEMGEKYSEDPEQWADAWAAYQEWYEDVMSQIDDYEESLDNVRQHINEVLATIEQVASNNAQIIKYKVQLEITEIDFGKSWQDYLMKKFNNDISKIADGMKATMAKIFGSGFDEAGKAMGGSLKALDVYLKQLDEAQEKYKTYLKYQDDIDSFMQNGDSEAYQKLQELLGFGSDGSDAADSFLTGAQFFEMAKEIREKILAELNNLEDYKQALSQSYTNLLSLTKSEWDKYNQIASHRYNLINTFKEIAELSGQNYGEEWEKWEAAMTAAQSQHLSDMMEQSQTLFETHAAQVAHFEQMLAQGQTLSNLEREQYEASLQAMQEAENQMYDYTKQKLALLKTEYEKTIDDIIKKFQKNILEGTDNTTFEELASDYEWWNKEQEMYLSTTKELYEVSKLNRTINDSIAESSSAATKARLAALKEEINKYAELNKLTEYDVQQLNLQYKLAMALDELENAQNNKSTVRLTRDEYGNMGYQYTTDEDKVSSAQQQYEDVLQEINDLATNRVKELEGAYIQTMQDYIAEARQIALEYADDEETREKKLEELAEKYSSRLNIINEQLGIATQHLLQNNDTIFEHYNENVERYIGTPNGEEGINPTIQQLSSAWENHESMVVDMTSAIIAAMQEYYQEAAATTEQVSATLQGMQDRFAGLQQATDYAEGSLSNLTDTLKDQYTELNDATEGWKAYAASVATAQEEAEKALQTISDLMAGVMGSDEAQAVLGALTGSGSGSGGTGSTGGSSGGDYGGGGDNKVDTVKYKFKKDAKVTKNWDGKTEVSGVSPLGEDKVYTVSKLKGNAVYIAELGGWIHVLDIMKETSKSSTYSTTALALSDAIAQKRIDLDDDDYTYATGGLADFTGPAWLDGTPSRPEYVLNAQQTDRMFDAIEATSKLDVGLISDIFDTINMLTSSLFAGMGNSISPNNIASTQNSDSHNIEQHVEIHAEFPDASDYTEIKEAFDNIINTATQYANR